MRIRVWAVVLLLLCSALAVQATTYTLALPSLANTHYLDYQLRSAEVDFGRTFSSIDSVTIVWEGQITTGHVTNFLPPYSSYDVPGWFRAAFDGYGMFASQTENGHFEQQTQFTRNGGGLPQWDFLLDGRASLEMFFGNDHIYTPGEGFAVPQGDMYWASLVLSGTPVPEPSSLLALLGGTGGLAAALRRRGANGGR